jgi:hypothetical protein
VPIVLGCNSPDTVPDSSPAPVVPSGLSRNFGPSVQVFRRRWRVPSPPRAPSVTPVCRGRRYAGIGRESIKRTGSCPLDASGAMVGAPLSVTPFDSPLPARLPASDCKTQMFRALSLLPPVASFGHGTCNPSSAFAWLLGGAVLVAAAPSSVAPRRSGSPPAPVATLSGSARHYSPSAPSCSLRGPAAPLAPARWWVASAQRFRSHMPLVSVLPRSALVQLDSHKVAPHWSLIRASFSRRPLGRRGLPRGLHVPVVVGPQINTSP